MNNIWDAIPFRENWDLLAFLCWVGLKQGVPKTRRRQAMHLAVLVKKHQSWTSSDKGNGVGMALFLFGIWPLVTTVFAPLLLLGAVLTKNVVRSLANSCLQMKNLTWWLDDLVGCKNLSNGSCALEQKNTTAWHTLCVLFKSFKFY